MGSLINYYEELHLSQTAAADDLDFELLRQEKTWRKRELSQPEKAADMIALITDARKAFRSEESKAEYDEALARSQQAPEKEEPDKERNELFEKWLNKAAAFYESGDTDLAEAAMEKALSYYNEKTEDDEFLSRVAQIYFDNGQPDKALSFINKALMINMSNWRYLYLKGAILLSKSETAAAYDSYCKALNIAIKQSDTDAEGYMQGVIADFQLKVNGDTAAAYQMAKKAVNNGDPTGFATVIIREMESNKAHSVTMSELEKYKSEPFIYQEKIAEVTNAIISRFKPVNGTGWDLCMKTSLYNEYDETSLDFDEHDLMTRYKYTLHPDGMIKAYRLVMTDKGKEKDWEQIGDGVDSILMETDINGLCCSLQLNDARNQGIEKYTTSVVDIRNMIKEASGPDAYIKMTRKTYQKGYGLYNMLVKLRDRLEAEEKMRHEEALRRVREEEEASRNAAMWKSEGKCQYCGGEFKRGMGGEKCLSCGRKKDY